MSEPEAEGDTKYPDPEATKASLSDRVDRLSTVLDMLDQHEKLDLKEDL